jgi:hypothetical protein
MAQCDVRRGVTEQLHAHTAPPTFESTSHFEKNVVENTIIIIIIIT